MAHNDAAPGTRLLHTWRRLLRIPGGRRIFDRLLGRMVPYTGALGARVLDLEPGHVRVALDERRRVRNHLGSIHAVALVNLGEVTGGLAVLTAIAPGVRGIVTRLDTVYLKKARGRVVAEARYDPAPVEATVETEVTAEVTDEAGDVVARVTAHWRLSPP